MLACGTLLYFVLPSSPRIDVLTMQSPEIPQSGDPFVPLEDGRCLINTLPVELLSHIFLLGHRKNDIAPSSVVGASNFVAGVGAYLTWNSVITEVCHLWREVAIRSAGLWTYVSFINEPLGHRQIVNLQRSRGAPLDIFILDVDYPEDRNIGSHSTADPLSNIQSVLAAILPHVARWRSFKLEVADYRLMTYAQEKLCQCSAAPLLEEFKLVHDESYEFDFDDFDSESAMELSKLDAFRTSKLGMFKGNFPLLKDVFFHGVPLVWSTCHFPESLTTLGLSKHADVLRPSYADFSRMLRSASQLSELWIQGSGPIGGLADRDTNTLDLPQLKTLSLLEMTPAHAKDLVLRMSMPQLVSLAFDFGRDKCSSFLRALSLDHPLMKHSVFSKLTDLAALGGACNSASVRTASKALTSLRTLRLDLSVLPHAWCDVLTGPPLACPSLDFLYVLGLDGSDLRRMISARREQGSPLRHLRIGRGTPVVTMADEQWLRSNISRFERTTIVSGAFFEELEFQGDTDTDEDMEAVDGDDK